MFFATQPAHYTAEKISKGSYRGIGAGRLYSRRANSNGHALLFQRISARDYLGQRVRASAFLKAAQVEGWAALWIRVDDEQGRVLMFDNMMNKPIRGSREWERYSVVVDIPAEAAEVHFGALLSGRGEILVDEFELQVSGTALPGRELKKRIRELPERPGNLGFEE